MTEQLMMMPSVEGIKALIKPSWFEVSRPMPQGSFFLETRDGWDGGDAPNPRNLTEARRVVSILRQAYPEWRVMPEVVDEWVIIEIKRR